MLWKNFPTLPNSNPPFLQARKKASVTTDTIVRNVRAAVKKYRLCAYSSANSNVWKMLFLDDESRKHVMHVPKQF